MKKIFLLVFIVIANLTFLAQNPKNWKDVTKEDFKYTRTDTSVHAIINFETANYYFDAWNEELKLFIAVHKRILIIDNKGLNYATIEIPYQSKNDYDEFVSFHAYYYENENGKIKKHKVKNKDIKDVDIDEFYSKRVLELSNLSPGSVIEYKYVIASLDIVQPPVWYFQHQIPCLYSSFSVKLPDFISYQLRINGNEYLTVSTKEESYTNIDYILHYNDPIPAGAYYRSQSFIAPVHFSFLSWLYNRTMTDIPAYEQQKFTDCDCNYLRSITLKLDRIDQDNSLSSKFDLFAWDILTQRIFQSTKDNYLVKNKFNTVQVNNPAGYIVFRITDWNDEDEKLKKNPNFGLQLLKTWEFKPELDSALKNASDTAIDKAISIYNYVRDNYLWNNIYGIYTTDDLSKIANSRTGNSADINMILIYLFKKAGLTAFPVLIKTVDKGHLDLDWASAKQFNNLIACVEIDNKRYFFDAKNKIIPWYILDENNLNYLGRIIKNQDSQFINISSNKKSTTNFILDLNFSHNNANCNLKIHDLGHFASNKRKNYDNWLSNFTKNINNITNLSTDVKNLLMPDKPLISILNFTITDFIQNNQIYPFDICQIDFLFSSFTRIIPVYFTDIQQFRYKIRINLPANKEIISIPQNKNLFLNGLSFLAQVNSNTNYIELDLQININKNYFNSIEYNDLRNFFLELENYINTPIIFY